MARAIRSMQKGAARAVLSGQADARAKPGTRAVEMIRHLKGARDTAVKSRTQAMITLKTIIVSAPAALREQLEGIPGKMALIRHLAALRPDLKRFVAREIFSYLCGAKAIMAAFGLAERRFRHRDRRCHSQASARARRKALSRTLRVSLAAASNSERASASRRARNRKSPLAAGNGA